MIPVGDEGLWQVSRCTRIVQSPHASCAGCWPDRSAQRHLACSRPHFTLRLRYRLSPNEERELGLEVMFPHPTEDDLPALLVWEVIGRRHDVWGFVLPVSDLLSVDLHGTISAQNGITWLFGVNFPWLPPGPKVSGIWRSSQTVDVTVRTDTKLGFPQG
jgi:hypothetical protein